MSTGGKGSAMRPAQVSKEKFANNWDAIFAKKAPAPVAPIAAYCLRVGCMTRCVTCQHGQAWDDLNELPELDRLDKQSQMRRINETQCQITSGTLYEPPVRNVWFIPVDRAIKEVGDIVSPKPGHNLRSGAEAYGAAVVVSVEPFVMVSSEADMRWGCEEACDYVVKGKAGIAQLARCMKRL